jgi:hypothetical protein
LSIVIGTVVDSSRGAFVVCVDETRPDATLGVECICCSGVVMDACVGFSVVGVLFWWIL